MKPYIAVLLTASAMAGSSVSSSTCKSCHPKIYDEYISSAHHLSSPGSDKLFKAVWSKAPNNKSCLKCHVAPSQKNLTAYSTIECTGCHSIKAIKHGDKTNSNIYDSRDKYFYSAQQSERGEKLSYEHQRSGWFGLSSKRSGSPYHTIDYSNDIYYNGKVCMGCHSHKKNKQGLTLCSTDVKGMDEKENCITCHMPDKVGSATTIRISKTHKFHGFSGSRFGEEMLGKYIDIKVTSTKDKMSVAIENKTPHPLLTHPMRLLVLKVKLYKDGKEVYSGKKSFARIVGRDGKPSAPWLANEIVRDDMIKADEKRVVSIDIPESVRFDKTEAVLGYYLVNPKMAKKMGIDKDSELMKFHILKRIVK